MRYLLTITLSLALLGQTKRVDDALLRNAAKSASDGDWLSYGLTPGETRFSPLKQIDASNVKRLGLVWSYEVGDGGGDQEATPLVWNNTIFGVTNWSIVFAVDARTGKEKWRWDPEVNRKATSDKMCCGVVNRGLALYHNKIYVPVNDGRLEALDAETGKPVWETRVSYVAKRADADHGAAHRKGQSDRRPGRRRPSHARFLRRIRCRHGPSGLEVLYGSRRSGQGFRVRGDAQSRRDLGRRLVEAWRRRRGMGRDLLRSRERTALRRHRQCRALARSAAHQRCQHGHVTTCTSPPSSP